MNKVKSKYIASFLILGSLAAGYAAINADSKSNFPNESGAYRYIQVSADFMKEYDDYDELISDSEVVVFGTVKDVNSYVDESRIVSKFDFVVSSIEKGNIASDEIISVITTGGRVQYSDYLNATKEYMEAKTSAEYVADEIKTHGNEYIESIFEGVPNVKEGDELLLFLSMQDDGENYYIVGSSHYGKFFYDADKEEVYKILMEDVPDALAKSRVEQRIMTLNKYELLEKVTMSIDHSTKIQKAGKTIKEDIIVGRDSSYDQYKK